jgi:hypothetical protein
MGIPPWADMDAHQTAVTAEQAAKSSADTPRKALDRTTMVNSFLLWLMDVS